MKRKFFAKGDLFRSNGTMILYSPKKANNGETLKTYKNEIGIILNNGIKMNNDGKVFLVFLGGTIGYLHEFGMEKIK